MQVSEKHKKLGNPVTETAVTETAVTVCARKQAETQERGREREREDLAMLLLRGLQNLKRPIWINMGDIESTGCDTSGISRSLVRSRRRHHKNNDGHEKALLALSSSLYIVHSASHLKCKTRPKMHQHVQV